MLLVVGGAYSGKRKVVKEMLNDCCWISAYDNQKWECWLEKKGKGGNLVFEGFEIWIEKEISSGKKMEEVVELFQAFIRTLARYEQGSDSSIVIVMLEMGRGIVPLEKKDRELRDAAGWILQEAAIHAGEVIYVWHGLAKRIK